MFADAKCPPVKESQLSKLKLKWDDIHVVFVSFRKLAQDLTEGATFSSSVQSLKILNRDALRYLYTKTLTSLPQLLEKQGKKEVLAKNTPRKSQTLKDYH